MKKIFVLVMGVMFLAACATVAPPQPGILGNYYKNLEPGPEGGAKLRWLKPGVDFSKYNKVKVDPIQFAPATDESKAKEMKDMDPEDLRELADTCNLALANGIEKKYLVVTAPGPDVVEVRFAIIDLKKSYPVFSGVTSVLPIGLALNLLKRPVTGRWTGGGSTIAQLMGKDSVTGEVIAVAQDNYEAGFWERFSRYGSAEDAFEAWGEKIVKFLDEAHGAKK